MAYEWTSGEKVFGMVPGWHNLYTGGYKASQGMTTDCPQQIKFLTNFPRNFAIAFVASFLLYTPVDNVVL